VHISFQINIGIGSIFFFFFYWQGQYLKIGVASVTAASVDATIQIKMLILLLRARMEIGKVFKTHLTGQVTITDSTAYILKGMFYILKSTSNGRDIT
jgi:hypothetical protein